MTVLSEFSGICLLLLLIQSGRLGVVDNDVVELNNMHRQVLVTITFFLSVEVIHSVRFGISGIYQVLMVQRLGTHHNFGPVLSQIIHTEAYIGRPKVESAADACRAYVTSYCSFG